MNTFFLIWLDTLEKQAPMCTLGVGGRPLLSGLGGELRCFRSFLRGGTGGVSSNKSGSGPSPI